MQFGSDSCVREMDEWCSFVAHGDAWRRMVQLAPKSTHVVPNEFKALAWWFPLNVAGDTGVSSGGVGEFTVVRQARQGPRTGSLFPCSCRVHATFGAALLTEVGTQMVGFEPGFMVPVPSYLANMFDWLYVGYCLRTRDEDESEFVDEDGLFDEDDGEFLKRLTRMCLPPFDFLGVPLEGLPERSGQLDCNDVINTKAVLIRS